MSAAVWVVAGAPGAGKSTVAALLARLVSPPAAVLDKDTLYRSFATQVLSEAGRPTGEREGPWYDEHVKVHEYGGLTAAAAQIRRAGCPVVLVAPFTQQIRDPDVWRRWCADLGGDPVRLVWVRLAPTALHDRLARRGRVEDAGKLADFDAFAARMRSDEPPPVPHVVVDTSGPRAHLRGLVRAAVRRATTTTTAARPPAAGGGTLGPASGPASGATAGPASGPTSGPRPGPAPVPGPPRRTSSPPR